VPLTCVAGLLVGAGVVVQAAVWLARLDQSALFGPLVANVVVQMLGPVLVNFFVIGRSGTAMATELANMAVHHEVEVIDSQGVDPFLYLVVPRVVGTAAAVLGLSLLLVAVALVTGYAVGLATREPALAGRQVIDGVLLAVRPATWPCSPPRRCCPG
jgi:phospholipid/cholesterol/gamma-HCH transport system permease protein